MRRIHPARMRFVHYSWPLRPETCPCDVHFCDYLRDRGVRGRSLFHFGTGGHHLVGITNHDSGLENDILGLTLAPREHDRYVARLVQDPGLGEHYKVLFADIRNLGSACLPEFDLVTLFHLCEFAETGGANRRMSDADVLRLFCSKLRHGGRLFLYSGSYGYPKAKELVAAAVADGVLSFEEAFKSLTVFCKAANGPGSVAAGRG